MIYGYLRVSSDEQDVESQKQGVDAFAREKGWEIDEYITDEGVSGGKDPSKRKLGPLLNKLQKGDIVICSEISRLGRDLYMVMDILHYAMEAGCVIHTVKDRFTLGDDIQSKVLAFAFGLAAEIERQMIRQRTKEGLALRIKMGVLLGRPISEDCKERRSNINLEDRKEEIIQQFKWGVPERRLATNFGCDRSTIQRWLHNWGVKKNRYIEREYKQRRALSLSYQKENFNPIKGEELESIRERLKILIMKDYTLPKISTYFPEYTYEQLYDTVLLDKELHLLYREYGHLVARKKGKFK